MASSINRALDGAADDGRFCFGCFFSFATAGFFMAMRLAGRFILETKSHVWCALCCLLILLQYNLLQVANLSSIKKWQPECNGPTSYVCWRWHIGNIKIDWDCKAGYAQIEVVTFCCWKVIPAAAPSLNLYEADSGNITSTSAPRQRPEDLKSSGWGFWPDCYC